MAQIKSPRRHKINRPDLRHRIDTNHPLLGGHSVHHYTVESALKGIVHTGATIEIHI